jgi:hypothetical protein
MGAKDFTMYIATIKTNESWVLLRHISKPRHFFQNGFSKEYKGNGAWKVLLRNYIHLGFPYARIIGQVSI